MSRHGRARPDDAGPDEPAVGDDDNDIESLQGEIDNLRAGAASLDDNLETAGSCETIEDFFANIDEALDDAQGLVRELTKLADRKPKA